jgi:hypothetical protein
MRERQKWQEVDLLSVRKELAPLRESLSARDWSVSGVGPVVSGLAARQKGNKREIQAICSSVLSIESSVKSVCARNNQTSADVSNARQEVGRVESLCGDLQKDVSKLNKVRAIGGWREGTETQFSNPKREIEAKRRLQEALGREVSVVKRDIASVAELREMTTCEAEYLKQGVRLMASQSDGVEVQVAAMKRK